MYTDVMKPQIFNNSQICPGHENNPPQIQPVNSRTEQLLLPLLGHLTKGHRDLVIVIVLVCVVVMMRDCMLLLGDVIAYPVHVLDMLFNGNCSSRFIIHC